MKKICLLHIISNLQFGGAEKQVVTLLKNLDKKKYRIILCCLYIGGPLEQEIENEDIEMVFIRMRLRYFIVALYKLVRLMKKENIQIVHTHLYSDHLWGRLAAWIAGVPIIVTTEHGRGMWKKKRHLAFELIANYFTDMKIAVSDDIRKIRIQREHTPSGKVITIPNAINPDDFIVSDCIKEVKRKELGLKNDELVIGTVARLDPAKALDQLLEASALVLKSIRNLRILCVGEGNLREYLMNYAATLGLTEKVIFTGARNDIAEMLSLMDVYVNSSVREGIPVSLLEAMAAKKAVVATNVGGNAEVINNEFCGLIVPPKDAITLAQRIIYLLENEPIREKMGIEARERVKMHFSVKVQAEKIDAIYEALLMSKTRSNN